MTISSTPAYQTWLPKDGWFNTTVISKMEIGASNSSPKSKLIGNQLGSLYRLLRIYSDGAAWFLACTSLISQHFPLRTYSMIHIPSLKAQWYIPQKGWLVRPQWAWNGSPWLPKIEVNMADFTVGNERGVRWRVLVVGNHCLSSSSNPIEKTMHTVSHRLNIQFGRITYVAASITID